MALPSKTSNTLCFQILIGNLWVIVVDTEAAAPPFKNCKTPFGPKSNTTLVKWANGDIKTTPAVGK